MIGAKILGPRIGKYDKNGKPQAILGHNLTFAALGVFILWFCWFGFNGASTVGMDSDALIETAGRVFFNTNLAAAVACCAALIFGRCGRRGGHWSCLWNPDCTGDRIF